MITCTDDWSEDGLGWAELVMADDCAGISRKFEGWAITWTSRCGYEARKGDDRIGPLSSRSAFLLVLRLAVRQEEQRAERLAAS